jgi:hypothetical protein
VVHLRQDESQTIAAGLRWVLDNAKGSAQVLREAIGKFNCDWQAYGATIPDAILAIFQRTGNIVDDKTTGLTIRELDLLAALDEVFSAGGQTF